MAGDRRCVPGGIGELLELIEEHRGAFEYDWRTRFGLPLTVVGGWEMSYGEAYRLTKELAVEPGSRVFAAVSGWAYPMSREALVTADLIDVIARAMFQRVHTTYPRPWDGPDVTRIGGTNLPQDYVRGVLDGRIPVGG